MAFRPRCCHRRKNRYRDAHTHIRCIPLHSYTLNHPLLSFFFLRCPLSLSAVLSFFQFLFFIHTIFSSDSEGGGGSRFGHASSSSNGKGYKRDRQEDTPNSSSSGNSNRSDFIEPLPSSFSGMFGDDCLMYRLHGNVPQNVRQTVYKDFCKAKSGIMLCTGEKEKNLHSVYVQ